MSNEKFSLTIRCVDGVEIIINNNEGISYDELQKLFLNYYDKCAENKGTLKVVTNHHARVVSIDKIISMDLYSESGF